MVAVNMIFLWLGPIQVLVPQLKHLLLVEHMQLLIPILQLEHFLEPYPMAKLVLGATTYQLYKEPSQLTSSSKPYRNTTYQCHYFITAFQIHSWD